MSGTEKLRAKEDYRTVLLENADRTHVLRGEWIDAPETDGGGYHSFYEVRKDGWYRDGDRMVAGGEYYSEDPQVRSTMVFVGHGWMARGCNPGGMDWTLWVGYEPFETEDGAVEAAMAEYEE